MKIGILIPSLAGGGAEFVAGQWADQLSRRGHDVTLITTHDPAGSVSGDAGVRVATLTATSFPTRVAAVRRHVGAAGYDVLLGLMAHWNVLALLGTVGRVDRPAVVISGRNIETSVRRRSGTAFLVELTLSRLLFRRAEAYVAISHPVAAEAMVRYRLPMERIWVVPNPSTGKIGSTAVRAAPGVDAKSVTLTVPSRLVAWKRPALAIEAAAVLRERDGLCAGVAYFGSGPEAPALVERGRQLGVPVHLHGWVDDWFTRAASDAVVVLPSGAEGFGNVLVEAAAAGLPSVASSRALGVADALIPEVTGILTLDDSPAAYATAVLRARTLTPISAARWLGRFTPAASTDQLLTVFEAVVASRTVGSGPPPPPTMTGAPIRLEGIRS